MARHDRNGPASRSPSRRSFLLGCLSVMSAIPVRTATLSGGRDFAADEAGPVKARATVAGTHMSSKYSFGNFVVGANNRFAHAAAFVVAEQPGKAYNPLFIYGAPAVGKTHLLHAVGNHARSLNPRLRIRCVTAEQFTNEFINSIRDNQAATFQRTYRATDLLLIDDIQFLEGKKCTQEQILWTFNALYETDRQIVITSSRTPEQMPGLTDHIQSRCRWGLLVHIDYPDAATHRAVLERRTARGRTSTSSRSRL